MRKKKGKNNKFRALISGVRYPSSSINYSRAHSKFKPPESQDYLHYYPRVVQLPPTAMNIYDSREGKTYFNGDCKYESHVSINRTTLSFKSKLRWELSIDP